MHFLYWVIGLLIYVSLVVLISKVLGHMRTYSDRGVLERRIVTGDRRKNQRSDALDRRRVERRRMERRSNDNAIPA